CRVALRPEERPPQVVVDPVDFPIFSSVILNSFRTDQSTTSSDQNASGHQPSVFRVAGGFMPTPTSSSAIPIFVANHPIGAHKGRSRDTKRRAHRSFPTPRSCTTLNGNQ